MQVKIANARISESCRALPALLNLSFNAVAAFRIAKLRRVLTQANEDLDSARKALIDVHVRRDEQNAPVVIDNHYQMADGPAFEAEFALLMAEEVTLDITPIELGSVGDSAVPVGVMVIFDWLFVDGAAAPSLAV